MGSCTDRRPGARRYTVWALLLGWLLLAAGGCNRAMYRRQADREVYALVDCAGRDPRWPLPDYTIQSHPQSRFFDPTSPDFPPMPPDDPTSHQLMHCVDCKPGWPCWRCYGRTPHVENPAWKESLPCNEEGVVVLDRRTAMRLALLHSRDYQNELEDLYLSALDVTFQRFRLDAQFFGGNSTFFTADGPDRAGGRQSLLETDTSLQMTRLTATGGELVVGLANSLVWQFAGPDDYTATTLLDFSLVQPLLRGAGRAVVLEELTAAERVLLANVRQMERFRRGFYADIITGRSPAAGPARGGVGLDAIVSIGGGAGGGMLGLLEDRLRIRNLRANVAGLRNSLEQLQAFYEAGRLTNRLQVDQARQSLYASQGQLLRSEKSYRDRLDAYKVSLGLPPELEVRIDDPLLSRFELIDPKLTATRENVDGLLRRLRDPQRAAAPEELLAKLPTLREDCAEMLAMVRRDLQAFGEALPARRRDLRRLAKRPEFAAGDVEAGAVDVVDLDNRAKALSEEFIQLHEKIGGTLLELERFDGAGAGEAGQLTRRLLPPIARLSDHLLALSLIQAGARLDTITLVPVDLDPAEAFRLARQNRRDWMNARAALVDRWRQIEVTANDLRGGLDLTFAGDLSTTDDNPVRFRGTTGRLRVGLELDAPLTRLAERNLYRETLIDYQRARRAYYAFEDRVSQSLRATLRQIELDQIDFELQRAAVQVAVSQVELTQIELQKPPEPGKASLLGATTARDVVDALRRLLDAQNDFLAIWVDYEVQRLGLDLDLGTMQLDAEGNWIDPGPIKPGESDDLELPELIPAPEGLPLPPPAGQP